MVCCCRGEADLSTPFAKYLCLALGLLFLGKQDVVEPTVEVRAGNNRYHSLFFFSHSFYRHFILLLFPFNPQRCCFICKRIILYPPSQRLEPCRVVVPYRVHEGGRTKHWYVTASGRQWPLPARLLYSKQFPGSMHQYPSAALA